MTTLSKLMAGTAVAALVSLSPINLAVGKTDKAQWITFEVNAAYAASGKGSEGDGSDSDNSGSGSDSSSGGGSDNSGSGSSDDDDDDDDNSGSGSDNDSDDDDDYSEDSSGRSKPRTPGGSGCDDPGDVAEHSECSASKPGESTSGGSTDDNGTRMIVKVEVSGTGIEIRYSNGTKEEIENGVYERKNANNRTVEQRPATGADIARLRALADRITVANVPSKSPDDQGVSKVEIVGDNIEVTYANGWKEEIEFGRYELKDRFNRTVVERPATDADRARLLEVVNG